MVPEDVTVGMNLSGEDLTGADLTNRILFATDLRGAKLFGAHITLKCDTFHGAKLDETQVALLILLLSLADVPAEWKQGMKDLAKRILGDDKKFSIIERYLQIA